MKLALTFTITFFAVIALSAAIYPVGKGLFRLGQRLEKRTGNSTVAHTAPMILFVALMAAVWMTVVIALVKK
jgi:hypothetical protein